MSKLPASRAVGYRGASSSICCNKSVSRPSQRSAWVFRSARPVKGTGHATRRMSRTLLRTVSSPLARQIRSFRRRVAERFLRSEKARANQHSGGAQHQRRGGPRAVGDATCDCYRQVRSNRIVDRGHQHHPPARDAVPAGFNTLNDKYIRLLVPVCRSPLADTVLDTSFASGCSIRFHLLKA
jgi:hypothetical protein